MRDFTGVSGEAGDGTAKLTPAPATRWTPEVANSIVQELKTLITDPAGGNVALNPASNGQVLAAVLGMIANALTSAFTLTVEAGNERTIGIAGIGKLKMGYFRETIVTETTRAVVFATPFPTACWHVFAMGVIDTASILRDLYPQVIHPLTTQNGFTVQFQAEDNDDNVVNGFDWIAIGN